MSEALKKIQSILSQLEFIHNKLDPDPNYILDDPTKIKQINNFLSSKLSIEDELQTLDLLLKDRDRNNYFLELEDKLNSLLIPYKERGYFTPFNEKERLRDSLLYGKFSYPFEIHNVRNRLWQPKLDLIVKFIDFVLMLLKQVEKYAKKVETLGIPGESSIEDSPSVDRLAYTLVLFYELGIIDLLKERLNQNGIEDKAVLAGLIGTISNTTEKKDIASLRKILSYLNTNHPKDPINKKSINKIKSILSQFGIEPQNI